MRAPIRIAVLVSGGGTNLQALIDARARGALRSGELVAVISSRADAYALERARAAGIEAIDASLSAAERAALAPAARRAALEARIVAALEACEAELIVLAGFMLILSAATVARWPGRIVNVHPSLIPAFCGPGYYGLKVHEAALARGVKLTGATVHLVDEVADGGPILAQRAVRVEPDDSPETLQRRVMEEAEWQLLPAAVEELAARLRGEESA